MGLSKCPNPKCEELDIVYGGPIEVDSDYVYQEVTCQCGASWTEVYNFSHICEYEPPEGEEHDKERTPVGG